MRQINTYSEIVEFKQLYEKLSGLEIPHEFFKYAKTYVFEKNKKIVGGFILSSKRPLRTLELFTANDQLRSKLNDAQPSEILEVCCFWVDRRLQRKKLFSIIAWIRMAIVITLQKERFILYGTNSWGLAKMYGYPKASILINMETIHRKKNYIFIAKREKFLIGAIMIVCAKLKANTITPTIVNNQKFEKSICNALSI